MNNKKTKEEIKSMDFNFIKELSLTNFTIDRESIVHRIMTEEEKLKSLLIEGIENQFNIIEADIKNIPTKYKKRWYKKYGTQYLVFIKYQNKPIPYLDNDNTAIVANSLEEILKIYQGIQKELKFNFDFVKHLLKKTKEMEIAKGRKGV